MHDDVAHCSVVRKPDPRIGNNTFAFIQAKPGNGVQDHKASLKQLCSEKLVKYKITDKSRFVDHFPRNEVG